MTNSTFHRIPAVVATAAIIVGAAMLAPTAASAADDSGAGWLRLGHLSPDTKAVDVRLTALAGGSTVFELDGVGYGDVSPYTELPAGTYTASMVPAGMDAATAPVVSTTVTVDAGDASTVAAYGPSDDLQVKVFSDDLAEPTAGNSRIRLIQASTLQDEVTVTTMTGASIAAGAMSGQATGYAEIASGDWSLVVSGANSTDKVAVSVEPGSVTSLFVLDTADGRLTVLPVLDSSSVGAVTPDGGVPAGGGWAATHAFADMTAAAPLSGRAAR